MLLSLAFAVAAIVSPIDANRLKEDVRTLSSDEFAGRGPGEAGEAKTIAYLAAAFEKAGLRPGGPNGSWYQDVPLVRIERLPGARMSLRSSAGDRALVPGVDATLALRDPGPTKIVAAPLVFAGYGVVDEAKGWDAYRGMDLAGKVAVVLANDPDFEAGQDLGFEGRRMTYPGRFGAKVEAAARAGALGVLVIHEDAAASYPFSQVTSGDAVPSFAFAPISPSSFKFSGWLRLDQAERLLSEAGLTLADLKHNARSPSFRAFALNGLTMSVQGRTKATPFTSHNVIAILPGESRPAEYVLYGAHWDANDRNGPDARGDAIRNGAIDNATGTAELLEVARAFGREKRSARSVLFAAWTSEEKGLLGAEYYAAHPLYPLASTAAVINLDPHVMLPKTRDLELIGGGRNSLEQDLTRVAAAQGLAVVPEPNPEAGWYFRSDHFAFSKKGVPSLAFRAGRDLENGGEAAGSAIVSLYNERCYHQPCDQFDPRWTLAAAAQEAFVAFAIGLDLASSSVWPKWNAGVEYGAVRARNGRDGSTR